MFECSVQILIYVRSWFSGLAWFSRAKRFQLQASYIDVVYGCSFQNTAGAFKVLLAALDRYLVTCPVRLDLFRGFWLRQESQSHF